MLSVNCLCENFLKVCLDLCAAGGRRSSSGTACTLAAGARPPGEALGLPEKTPLVFTLNNPSIIDPIKPLGCYVGQETFLVQ